MKKLLSFLVVMMFVFPLSACDAAGKENSSDIESSSTLPSSPDSGGTVDGSENTADDDRDFLKENFPPYEEVQAKYPDKTVLVWAITETGYERHAPFPSAKMNEYLDEHGCEFAVCFKPVYSAADERFPYPMLTEVKELLDNGEHIDIISPMNYDEFVFVGLYEPLDEYLETDIGRELYSAIPEKFWESLRINGGIYGLSGDMTNALSPDRGYYVNAELAEKNGYDVTKPILEQLDILKAVRKTKKIPTFSRYL